MHGYVVNYEVFWMLKITRMANERYFRPIFDKFNVTKICSSGNCECKSIISHEFFFVIARQPCWVEASSTWYLDDT
jgi:hypothetical protein